MLQILKEIVGPLLRVQQQTVECFVTKPVPFVFEEIVEVRGWSHKNARDKESRNNLGLPFFTACGIVDFPFLPVGDWTNFQRRLSCFVRELHRWMKSTPPWLCQVFECGVSFGSVWKKGERNVMEDFIQVSQVIRARWNAFFNSLKVSGSACVSLFVEGESCLPIHLRGSCRIMMRRTCTGSVTSLASTRIHELPSRRT